MAQKMPAQKMPDGLQQYVNFAVKFYKAMHDGQISDLRKYWNLMRVIKSEEWFDSMINENYESVVSFINRKLEEIENFKLTSFNTTPRFLVAAVPKLTEKSYIEFEKTGYYKQCLRNWEKRPSVRQCEVQMITGIKFQFIEYSDVPYLWVNQTEVKLFKKIHNITMINELEHFEVEMDRGTWDFKLEKPDALKLKKWIQESEQEKIRNLLIQPDTLPSVTQSYSNPYFVTVTMAK